MAALGTLCCMEVTGLDLDDCCQGVQLAVRGVVLEV
jgi:hypothetical protein